MIDIKLECPVILRSQVKELSEFLQMDKDVVSCVRNYSRYVVKGGSLDSEILTEKEFRENKLSEDDVLLGAEALIYLGEKKEVDVDYIDRIELNNDVFCECDNIDWFDICQLCMRVELKNDRLRRVTEMEAPQLIIRNERRMLQDAVDALEDNKNVANPVTWKSGLEIISLFDIGYSLIDGWSIAKLEEFRRAEEMYEEDFEDEEYEDDDYEYEEEA